MEAWTLFLVLWVAAQVPFARYLVKKKALSKKYPHQACWILVPLSSRWKAGVSAADMEEMSQHRSRMLRDYYLIFLAPLFGFFVLLGVGAL